MVSTLTVDRYFSVVQRLMMILKSSLPFLALASVVPKGNTQFKVWIKWFPIPSRHSLITDHHQAKLQLCPGKRSHLGHI